MKIVDVRPKYPLGEVVTQFHKAIMSPMATTPNMNVQKTGLELNHLRNLSIRVSGYASSSPDDATDLGEFRGGV
jgi:hypothetical protein